MKKIVSLITALAIALSLSVSAMAWEEPPTKYLSFDEYLDFYRASADPDTKELAFWLDAWIDKHPREYTAFDANTFFDANINGTAAGVNKGNWYGWNGPGYGEEHFKAEMCNLWLTGLFGAWQEAQKGVDASVRYPEEFAPFDADAWFAGYYGGVLGVTKERYMAVERLDTAGFKRDMFAEWAGGERCRYNGFVITVDGTPLLFEPVVYDGMSIPGVVDGRIRAPLPALEKAMGFQSSYDEQTGFLTCTKGDKTVRLTESDGVFQTNVYLYVPLRALAEALGYTVTWNGPLQTAQLTTSTEKD